MDKHTFELLPSVVSEVKERLGNRVFSVKYELVLPIKPLEGEVHYASAFEVVWNLRARAVDDVRHFVGHDELLVLKNEHD